MNKEWSLDALYKGYQDEVFQQDLKKVKELISTIKTYVANLQKEEPEAALLTLIQYLEEYEVLHGKLYAYTSLRQSTNTTDSQSTALLEKIEEINSTLSKVLAIIQKYISSIDDIDKLIAENNKLKEYSFMLHEIKSKAKHTLSDEVEEVIAKMNLSAGSAWSSLQEYLTSTVVVDYNGEETTLSSIRNLAYDPDQKVRKSAYEAEIAAYDKVKGPVAFALNNIKSQVNTIAELRGYESPLAMTLVQARMKKETLDAMLTAMKEYMPKFHAYLKKKAEILGHKNGLPWYDLFAPLGESNRTFTVEEAKEYLVTHFRKFADDSADLIETAFNEEWIDFFPHQGKVGGAFCLNLPYIKQSRILTNFDSTLSDVVTLAHELGHAYHGYHIQEHLPLNTTYSMPVAETASNFNELIIMNAAIEESNGKEKFALLESQLQDTTQIICDIYSRFLFESAVFEKRKDSFMFPEELENMMLEAQKEAYGDGLDHSCLHPYMWICKGHYYSEALSFYNFPYAFGGLFARGLYAKYLEEGSSFVPKYHDILRATTVSTVEDVAAMAGIDLTTPDFWRKSLQSIAESIDVFLSMNV